MLYPGLEEIIIDAVLLVVLLAAVIVGAVRGLFRSVMSIVVIVVAIFVASFVSRLAAEPLADWLYPKVEESLNLSTTLSSLLTDEIKQAIEAEDQKTEKLVEAIAKTEMYKNVAGAITRFGITDEKIRETLAQTIDDFDFSSAVPEDALKEAVTTLGKTILRGIIVAILFLILFLLLSFLLTWAVKGLNELISKIPVVGALNALGGIILGGGICLLLIWVVLMFLSGIGLGFFEQHREGTLLLNLLMTYNPLTQLIH